MSVANVTELWQLAATLMGETGTSRILSSSSLTMPLEFTFNAFYDQVRKTLIKRGAFDFAKKNRVLRQAPTVDYLGKTHGWSNHWTYAYSPPVDQLKFLRFTADIPELGVFHDYLMQRLPIVYRASTADTIVAGVFNYTATPSTFLWRGSIRASFFDEVLDPFTIVDKAVGPASVEYSFVDSEEDTTDLSDTFVPNYEDGFPASFDLAVGDSAGIFDFGSSAWPGSITLEYATGDPYLEPGSAADKWTDHIMTHLTDAEAVYLVDVTDVTQWPEDFQLAIASEMARRAALVHSKSSKMIQGLARASVISFSDAVATLTSDDGTIEGGQISGAEKARL